MSEPKLGSIQIRMTDKEGRVSVRIGTRDFSYVRRLFDIPREENGSISLGPDLKERAIREWEARKRRDLGSPFAMLCPGR